MRYLFNLAYGLAALTAAPWLAYAAWRHGKYREGWREKLLGLVARPKPGGPCVWLHAVSVGEVNLLAPLLTLFRARHPDWRVVISTTTLAGRRLAEQRYGEQATIIYCPLDFSWAVAAAMRRIRPRLLVLAELELWPNLIAAARRSGAKVVVVNGRLSERSFRGYRRIRGLLRRTLASVDLFAVQNQAYAERFIQLGAPAERVRVSGSVKFDGAITDRRNPQSVTLARLWNVEGTAPVFVAGSTQHPEEQLVLDAYRHLRGEFPTLRLILVPRHPERFDAVARMLEASGLAWSRRSQLPNVPRPDAPILLVDTVGELRGWWGLADVAFVGGSLGDRGGQNMIEPAAFGAAVCFGPNTRNFRDIVQLLLEREAAEVVADGAALTRFVERALRDPVYRDLLGSRAAHLVRQQQGATQRTVDWIDGVLAADRGAGELPRGRPRAA